MNSKELRIGNYVEVESVIAEVVGIGNHDENDIEILFSANNIIKINAGRANPVILTNDFLVKHCNFDTNGWYVIGIDNHSHFLEFRGDYILLASKEHEPIMHFWDVRFLHRLQNMYFALKGEEIQIVFNG